MDRRFPPQLAAAIAALSEGWSRQALAGRAEALSRAYRQDAASSSAVVGESDALAYAVARMPATFAATLHVLEELVGRAPGFAPRTLLDAGAGPGTASWAAARALPSLCSMVMIDHNFRFRALAESLRSAAPTEALRMARIEAGEIGRRASGGCFDLVIAAYALTEMDAPASIAAAKALFAQSAGVLVIVEPGRPRDYRRLMAIRTELIAGGAEIVAPCPHKGACPLPTDDWCHFAVRLARGRDHRRLKGGAAPFEDEKFAYLVVARPGLAFAPALARVIRPPHIGKVGIDLMLCTQTGLAETRLGRREEGFGSARRLDWGAAADLPAKR